MLRFKGVRMGGGLEDGKALSNGRLAKGLDQQPRDVALPRDAATAGTASATTADGMSNMARQPPCLPSPEGGRVHRPCARAPPQQEDMGLHSDVRSGGTGSFPAARGQGGHTSRASKTVARLGGLAPLDLSTRISLRRALATANSLRQRSSGGVGAAVPKAQRRSWTSTGGDRGATHLAIPPALPLAAESSACEVAVPGSEVSPLRPEGLCPSIRILDFQRHQQQGGQNTDCHRDTDGLYASASSKADMDRAKDSAALCCWARRRREAAPPETAVDCDGLIVVGNRMRNRGVRVLLPEGDGQQFAAAVDSRCWKGVRPKDSSAVGDGLTVDNMEGHNIWDEDEFPHYDDPYADDDFVCQPQEAFG